MRPKGRKSRLRPRAGVGFLRRGSKPLPSAKGSGERSELPQRGSGRSPNRPKVIHFSALRMASPDTRPIILLIVDHKKFLYHSIFSQLL